MHLIMPHAIVTCAFVHLYLTFCELSHATERTGAQIWVCLLLFQCITLKKLNGLTTADESDRKSVLVAVVVFFLMMMVYVV